MIQSRQRQALYGAQVICRVAVTTLTMEGRDKPWLSVAHANARDASNAEVLEIQQAFKEVV